MECDRCPTFTFVRMGCPDGSAETGVHRSLYCKVLDRLTA
jgi:hypothetical protein